jgi:hypothetical protein
MRAADIPTRVATLKTGTWELETSPNKCRQCGNQLVWVHRYLERLPNVIGYTLKNEELGCVCTHTHKVLERLLSR